MNAQIKSTIDASSFQKFRILLLWMSFAYFSFILYKYFIYPPKESIYASLKYLIAIWMALRIILLFTWKKLSVDDSTSYMMGLAQAFVLAYLSSCALIYLDKLWLLGMIEKYPFYADNPIRYCIHVGCFFYFLGLIWDYLRCRNKKNITLPLFELVLIYYGMMMAALQIIFINSWIH